MSFLLDSHAFVWAAIDPGRLSAAARDALLVDEDVFVSPITAYEIELKRDRDPTLADAPADFRVAARALELQWLDVSIEDCVVAARLPTIHRDPWDRLIVAQAMNRNLRLISRDGLLSAYGVPILW